MMGLENLFFRSRNSLEAISLERESIVFLYQTKFESLINEFVSKGPFMSTLVDKKSGWNMQIGVNVTIDPSGAQANY